VVEILAAYSHTTQAVDLRFCVSTPTRDQCPETKPATTAPWSLRKRLSDDMIQAMTCAYGAGATARELAATYDLSLSSIKRHLRTAGVRRPPPTGQSEKATLAATYPQPLMPGAPRTLRHEQTFRVQQSGRNVNRRVYSGKALGPTAVPRSWCESEDGEGPVHAACGPSGGFGDIGASG
jgi:hypothetical protein